ncbi:MAG: GLUG motif-containing protein, partial [Planctomycetota bacterium]
TFTGTFDGNDCTISNFTLTSTRQENTGLFGTVGAAGEIKNLRLLNPDIFAQGRNVGSLIGYLNHGSITNCRAKGAAVSGGSYVGGLVGTNTGNITKCGSTGSVWADAYVGGLVGQVGDGKVTMSYSKASVSGNRNVGGLVGKTGSEASEVTHCYAAGTVTGSSYVGGLVGQVERGNAYNLVGYTRVLGRVAQSFWDTQTSGQATSAGGTSKTTAEMKMASTFSSAGWDFWNTWTICEEMNYPVLQWQIPAADFLCPDGVDFIDFAFFAERLNQRRDIATNQIIIAMAQT